MDNWQDSNVLVSTTDKHTYTGKLLSYDLTGIIIAIENVHEAEPPFDSLSTSSRVEAWIPTHRIKHVARGTYTID